MPTNQLSAYGDVLRVEGEVSIKEPMTLILGAAKAIGNQAVATRDALREQGIDLDPSSLVVHTTEDYEGHIQIGWRMYPFAARHFGRHSSIEHQFPFIDIVLTNIIATRLEDASSL